MYIYISMHVCGTQIEESIKESTVNSMAVVRDNLPTKNTLWSILFCCVHVCVAVLSRR